MIGFAGLDMMARGGTLALLALWSVLLIRDHWAALPARMAMCMNAAISAHVISSIPGPIRIDHPIEWVFVLGSTSVPGFFWLFAKTWFNDEIRVAPRNWALIAAASLFTAASILLYQRRIDASLTGLIGAAARATMFAFAIAGLWEAWRGRAGDLVETRRDLRARLVWAVGCFVILTLIVEIAVYRDAAPRSWLTVIEVGAMALTWMLCIEMLALRQADMFSPTKAERPVPEATANHPLAAQIIAHMDTHLPHRDEAMTISKLAGQLGEQEYRVRRIINGALGYRNFAAFLNDYRLREVKAALVDRAQRDVPILTIALDAGFGSLGPFNRAFREAEGMTPSEYRASA